MADKAKRRMLIVDGYNVLNQNGQMLHGRKLDEARDQLIRELHDYAGYTGQQVVLVFDAWRGERRQRTVDKQGPISVVYTKRAETADHYIERLCDKHKRDVDYGRLEIRVATSDLVEQTVVFGRGATRISARELISEMEAMRASGRLAGRPAKPAKSTVMDGLPQDVRDQLERMRRGES